MKVGSTVRLNRPCLGNDSGTLGVCYSVDNDLGRPSYGVLFENGNHDGFSPDEVGLFLEPAGFSKDVEGYQFTNVVKLSHDYDQGVFDAALLKAGMAKLTTSEDVPLGGSL